MSLSIVQVVFIFVTLLSFSKPNVVKAGTSDSQLKNACNNPDVMRFVTPDLCLTILKSQHKVVSSYKKTDFAIAIIKSGISNGTNTRTYIENTLKKANLDNNYKGVLNECKSSYDYAVGSLKSALSEVKIHEYLTASYDLLIASTDAIQQCGNAVASKKINDATILIGNKVLPMFGCIGFEVVNGL